MYVWVLCSSYGIMPSHQLSLQYALMPYETATVVLNYTDKVSRSYQVLHAIFIAKVMVDFVSNSMSLCNKHNTSYLLKIKQFKTENVLYILPVN